MSHRMRVDSALSHSDDRVSVREEVNRTMEGLLPWAVSVLMHLGIVLIAFFVVWSAGQTVKEEDVLVTMRPPMDDSPPLADTPDMPLVKWTQMPVEIRDREPTKGELNSPVLTEQVRADLSTIGVVGGPPALIGLPDATGTEATIIGDPRKLGGATTIVYCVDASGSMVDTFAYVIRDLQKSLGRLSDKQRFTVIFFQAGSALEVPVPNRGYKKATAENVKAVCDWISVGGGNVVPRGTTDPVSAVKLGLGYQPQVMYLLSDNITGRGRYQVDRGDLVSLIDQLQQSHRVKTRINTIQFIYPDPLGTLNEIAKNNGGSARFVDESLIGGKD